MFFHCSRRQGRTGLLFSMQNDSGVTKTGYFFRRAATTREGFLGADLGNFAPSPAPLFASMCNVKGVASLPTFPADAREVCLSTSPGICFISGIDFSSKLPQVSAIKIAACAATPGSIPCICLFSGAAPPTKHVNKILIPLLTVLISLAA